MSKSQLHQSLFEYLGKAAGPDLGKEVMEAALSHKDYVLISEQSITTPYYDGVVKTYPKFFLDEFFKKEEKSSFRPEIKVEERINMLLNQVESLESRVRSLEGDDGLPF